MIKGLEIYTLMLQKLISKKIHITHTFDVHLLSKVIKEGLASDHSVVLVKVMLFLYNTAPFFNQYSLGRFTMGIIKDHFLNLFCHWSKPVRVVFHNLFWFRMYHIFRHVLSDLHDVL